MAALACCAFVGCVELWRQAAYRVRIMLVAWLVGPDAAAYLCYNLADDYHLAGGELIAGESVLFAMRPRLAISFSLAWGCSVWFCLFVCPCLLPNFLPFFVGFVKCLFSMHPFFAQKWSCMALFRPAVYFLTSCFIVRTGFDNYVDSTFPSGSYQQASSYYYHCIIVICPSLDGKSFDKNVEKLHHLMDSVKIYPL